MLGAITTNAYDVDGGPLLSIIPKDRSSLKAFIIEVFNKVHKSHKKPPDLYRSPHAQLPEIKGVRDSPKTKKQEDHVGNQIKKQDNKAFVQRNEKNQTSQVE